MKISFGVGAPTEDRLRYAKQLGADGVSCAAQAIPGYVERGYATVDELAELRKQVESFGLELLVLRLAPQATAAVLAGRPERDREIEHICATIRAAGAAGIPTVFYNLTPWRSLSVAWPQVPSAPVPGPGELRVGSGPGRYYKPVGRGGAVLLTHESARVPVDSARVAPEVLAPYGQISADELWARIRYFYEQVIPVAEEAGVNVGAHPDDPPEPSYRGVQQILNCVDGLKRLVDLVPSPRSGLLLCVGTLHEMGEDTMDAIEYFLQLGKVFYVHFRNPRGTVRRGYYQEDFLDEGDLDMLAVMRLFHRYAYQGGLDPDHAIGVVNDPDGRIAFAWELGYMKALKAAVEAEGRA
jgi:mannonate dehydratase